MALDSLIQFPCLNSKGSIINDHALFETESLLSLLNDDEKLVLRDSKGKDKFKYFKQMLRTRGAKYANVDADTGVKRKKLVCFW